MSEGKFCLRWKDYESSLGPTFSTMRGDQAFSDVTLACRGGQVEAHRVVLAASSTLLSTILRRNHHPHPLIYLKDVEVGELEALLDFMYCGKAQVEQKGLEGFLRVGEELEVRGLQDQGRAGTSPPGASSTPSLKLPMPKLATSPHPPQASGRALINGTTDQTDAPPSPEEILTQVQVKLEVAEEEGQDDVNESVTSWEDLGRYVIKEGKYSCSICGKSVGGRNMVRMKMHIESVHFPGHFSYPCDKCTVISMTKCAFIQHKRQKHSAKVLELEDDERGAQEAAGGVETDSQEF